jgi:hypothetical protein
MLKCAAGVGAEKPDAVLRSATPRPTSSNGHNASKAEAQFLASYSAPAGHWQVDGYGISRVAMSIPRRQSLRSPAASARMSSMCSFATDLMARSLCQHRLGYLVDVYGPLFAGLGVSRVWVPADFLQTPRIGLRRHEPVTARRVAPRLQVRIPRLLSLRRRAGRPCPCRVAIPSWLWQPVHVVRANPVSASMGPCGGRCTGWPGDPRAPPVRRFRKSDRPPQSRDLSPVRQASACGSPIEMSVGHAVIDAFGVTSAGRDPDEQAWRGDQKVITLPSRKPCTFTVLFALEPMAPVIKL